MLRDAGHEVRAAAAGVVSTAMQHRAMRQVGLCRLGRYCDDFRARMLANCLREDSRDVCRGVVSCNDERDSHQC